VSLPRAARNAVMSTQSQEGYGIIATLEGPLDKATALANAAATGLTSPDTTNLVRLVVPSLRKKIKSRGFTMTKLTSQRI